MPLIEERDHALAALKELEFDHRTGKVDDEDYRAARRATAAGRRRGAPALDGRLAEGQPEDGENRAR